MLRRRAVPTTALVVLLLLLAFSFPGVRAAASDFLGLFRVEKFAPLSISAEQLALLEEISNSGLYPGELVMEGEQGEPQAVASVAEAAALVDFTPRQPGTLADPERIFVSPGSSGRLIIDLASARAIMDQVGVDPTLLPDSLDGEEISVHMDAGVSQAWADGTALTQVPSPLVAYPEGVDEAALGEALLRVLGMDPREAARLAGSIDWTTTLLVPIPEGVASFGEVPVDGQPGLALESLDGEHAGLLWQRDGIVYALSGRSVDELLDIAASLD